MLLVLHVCADRPSTVQVVACPPVEYPGLQVISQDCPPPKTDGQLPNVPNSGTGTGQLAMHVCATNPPSVNRYQYQEELYPVLQLN